MGGWDAIVAGGGLAGAAFALESARLGGRVAIVERTHVAHHKVCGDFLSAEAQHMLAHLGIDIVAMNARSAHRLRLAAGTRAAVAPLPFTGVSVSRKVLDEVLLHAAERAGVTIMRGEGVTALEAQATRVSVRTAHQVIEGRTAVLATGKHNLRGIARPLVGATAFKMVFEPTAAAAASLDRIVQLASHAGGYVGSCLLEDGSVSVCWLASPAFLRAAGQEWRKQLDWMSRRSPHFGDLIAGAVPLMQRPLAVSAIPFGYRRRQAVAPNVYAVGDQLAVIHSFTGDGTAIALMSGVAAAHAVASGQAAEAYQTRFLKRIAPQLRWARAVDAGFATSLARWLGIRGVALVPAIATRIATLTRLGNPGFDLPAARAPAP